MTEDLPASSSSPASGSAPPARPKRIFNLLSEAAAHVLRRRFRVVYLVREAYRRMLSHSDVLSAVWRDLRTMLRLLLRWVDRSYRRVSWTPLVLVVGALLYLVVPVDVIPDALGAVGFIDDVTVISTVVRKVRHELDRFREWENTRSLPE